MLNSSKVVGLPFSRIDGPLKVTGQAGYAAEYFAPDMLQGYVVCSTITTGRITRIDTSAAERVPGVVKIYTHQNRPKAAKSDEKWKDEVALPGHPLRPLENDRILYDGQPVALVVAESFEAARDAAALVRVEYEAGVPHTDLSREQGNAYVPPVPRMKAMRKRPLPRRPTRFPANTRSKANTTIRWNCSAPRRFAMRTAAI
jgi:xanthine dehydrogenase YagR molybdenum-binding subunit